MIDGTESIESRGDFAKFVAQLLTDVRNGQLIPESASAEQLLQSISVYADAVSGYYENMKIGDDVEKPTWRLFAQIVAGALVQE